MMTRYERSGPFETGAEADRAAVEDEAAGRDLAGVLYAAGVDLGAYDLRILRWAERSLDPPTRQVLMGWIRRAARDSLPPRMAP